MKFTLLFYKLNINYNMKECNYKCYSCVTTVTNCVLCATSSFRDLTTNPKCLCNIGYYEAVANDIICSRNKLIILFINSYCSIYIHIYINKTFLFYKNYIIYEI